MSLLQAAIDTSVTALWRGNQSGPVLICGVSVLVPGL
jgi:hypothetical protein